MSFQIVLFLVSFFDYYLEDIGNIRTFALSTKKDEICGLTGQQKLPSAQASVS